MREYFIGGTFFIFFSVFLYILGSAIVNQKERYSYKLIIGYLVYSFFVAVCGIAVQVLYLPWKIFEIYMFVLIFCSVLFCTYRIRKNKIKIFPPSIKEFVFNHWFIIVLLLFLMFLTLFNYRSYWFNNHLDDGYYINKMVILPYVDNPFQITPATGFLNNAGINSYSLGTHELEMTFYLYFLNMTPTLFIRFYLAGFHYFLFINAIYAFAEKVFSLSKISYKKWQIQFIPSIIILFAFNELFLKQMGVIALQDSNQFCNAMYYGSSIVRTMSILFLLLPFIQEDKLSLKMILEVMAISLVLLSKSAISLPIIFVTILGYTLTVFMLDKKIYKISALIIVAIVMMLNFVMTNNIEISKIGRYAFTNLQNNLHLIAFIPVILVILLSFFYRIEIINKINMIFVVIFVLLVIPFMNNFISFFAFYPFVIGRAFTCLYYTMCIVAVIYIYIFINKIHLKTVFSSALITMSVFGLSIGSLISMQEAGGSLFSGDDLTGMDLINAFETMQNNNKFIPDSSLQLGKILNRLCDEKNEDIYVISRELQEVNGSAYALATSLTTIAPSVKSVSAKFRYEGMTEDNPFNDYSNEEQMIYEKFMFQLDDKVYREFKKILDKYPINCVILVVDDKEEYMNKLGFQLYDQVISPEAGVVYYVYEK